MCLVSRLKGREIVMLNEVKHLGGSEETLHLPELCSGAQGDSRYFG